MDSFQLIFYLGFILLVVVLLGRFALGIIRSGSDVVNHLTGYRLKHWYYTTFNKKSLSPEYKVILSEYFTYYNNLSPNDQELFERKVQTFIDMKKFIVRTDQITLTDEMIVLISACAVQLSFGFQGIFFRHFYRILIYPDNYYSTITRQYHQGEVNRGGIIVLSWKNFLSGYADETDGRNLGLHEMAHALLLENHIINGEYEFIDDEALDNWWELAKKELYAIQRGGSIFRAYGATNEHELFAVAVEIYFERPHELKKYSEHWYRVMAKLLNQDILKLTGTPY